MFQQNLLTFFCLYLMASFNRLSFILSVIGVSILGGSTVLHPGLLSWLRTISNSFDPRVWSNRSTAKSWHFLHRFSYSFLNSFSKLLNLRNSQLSSNAVNIGSLLDRAMRDGLAKARYALILDLECRRQSSWLSVKQCLQVQRRLWGFGILYPRSNNSLMIS